MFHVKQKKYLRKSSPESFAPDGGQRADADETSRRVKGAVFARARKFAKRTLDAALVAA